MAKISRAGKTGAAPKEKQEVTSLLELRNICYSVQDTAGETDILKDVTLTVPDRQLLVLTGPNGGGKTTLAKVIMGLVRPSSGQVIWHGEDVTELDITGRARLGIGYGFQQPPRFKGIRVRDLLSIAAGKRPLTRAVACSYLTQVGLCANDYLDREVDTSLSGGEVKRIEIATILAKQPSLMILDEPEAGIDLWSFARLTETFGELHEREECTMIIISHQERIISLADEIAVVDKGVISHLGSRDEVLPAILSSTLGACPVAYGEKEGATA